MNIYRIGSVCEVERPGKGLRQVYASAPGSPRGVDMVEHFDGKPYRVGSFRRLTRPAFRADEIGRDVSLFKLPQNHGNAIYCVERTDNPADGEFKALVEEHGLTGLEFELIWTDRKPRKRPAAKRRER